MDWKQNQHCEGEGVSSGRRDGRPTGVFEARALSPFASRLPVGEADQADLTVIRVGFVDLYLVGCAALAASVGGRVCTKAGHVRDSQHPS